jgi:hypothetical protein
MIFHLKKKNNIFSYLINLHFNVINNFYLYIFCLIYVILLTITNKFFVLDSNIIIFLTFSSFLFLGLSFINNKNATLIMDQNFINHIIFNLLEKIIIILTSFLFIIKLKYIQYTLDQIQFIFKLLNNLYYLMESNKDRHIIINNLAHSILLLNAVMFLYEDIIEETEDNMSNFDVNTPVVSESEALLELFNKN